MPLHAMQHAIICYCYSIYAQAEARMALRHDAAAGTHMFEERYLRGRGHGRVSRTKARAKTVFLYAASHDDAPCARDAPPPPICALVRAMRYYDADMMRE